MSIHREIRRSDKQFTKMDKTVSNTQLVDPWFSNYATAANITNTVDTKLLTSFPMPEEIITGSKIDLDLSAGSTYMQVYRVVIIFR